MFTIVGRASLPAIGSLRREHQSQSQAGTPAPLIQRLCANLLKRNGGAQPPRGFFVAYASYLMVYLYL